MQDFPAAKAALQLWYAEFIRYDFKNFNELKAFLWKRQYSC